MIEFEAVSEKNRKRALLDPRTKMLALFVINTIMLAGHITGVEFYIRIIVATIPGILLLENGKYKVTTIYLALFSGAVLGEGVMVRYASGNLNLVFLFLSGIISRFLPGFMMGYYMVSSTIVSEFITAMERLHITRNITIPMSVMFRYFPTIAEENKAISAAMRMRGIGFRGKRNNLVTMLEYRLVPIMMSTIKIGDELSAASLTKGLGIDTERTCICKIGFSWQDAIVTLLLIVCFAGFLLFE